MRHLAVDLTEDLLWEARWAKGIGLIVSVGGTVRRTQCEATGPTFSADSLLVDTLLLVSDVQGP